MSDFILNAKARAVLARHWIETEALAVSAVNGAVYVRGLIRYRSARERQLGELKADELSRIERELRSIPMVKRLTFQLENWQRDDLGGWIRTDGKARKAARPGQAIPGAPAAPPGSAGEGGAGAAPSGAPPPTV